MTSNLKGDFKMVVIHGDLWMSPREFQKPGLSSHNSQETQLKVSHRSLVQRVWTGSAGQSPGSLYSKEQSPGSLHPNTCMVLSHTLQMLSKAVPKTIPQCGWDQHKLRQQLCVISISACC